MTEKLREAAQAVIDGFHAGGVDAEYKRNLDAETMNRNARGMFVARLENMQENGNHLLTVTAVLALLSDCDMLAAMNGPND